MARIAKGDVRPGLELEAFTTVTTFLVTGCTGEVGKRLVPNLVNLGHRVYGIRGKQECQNQSALHVCHSINLLNEKFDFRKNKIDEIIHLAWITRPGEYADSPENNRWLQASEEIIMDFIQSGGKKVIAAGTCAEYRWSQKGTSHVDIKPERLYGKSKVSLLNFIKKQDIEYLWPRTFFQYGMSEKSGKLIPSIIDSLNNSSKFTVNNPDDIMDFIFVEDVANLYLNAILDKTTGIIDLGTFTGISVGEMAKRIAAKMNKLELVEFEKQLREPLRVVPNSNTISPTVEKYNFTRLEKALERTINSRKK